EGRRQAQTYHPCQARLQGGRHAARHSTERGIDLRGGATQGRPVIDGFSPRTPQTRERTMVTTPSGLQYEDEVVGTGQEAKKFDVVEVHYTGTLKDGKKFDSSKDRGQPFAFLLGGGQVIKG